MWLHFFYGFWITENKTLYFGIVVSTDFFNFDKKG